MVYKTNLKHKKVIVLFFLFYLHTKISFALYVLNIPEIGQSVLFLRKITES